MGVDRIARRFERCAAENRTALVAYLMGGDPDLETSFEALKVLRDNGADVIELGAPFTDPMADGPSIQKAALRSLAQKTTLNDVLELACRFRADDSDTPLILMGYANPIHHMGYEAFAAAAHKAGLDGSIIVDLPPEEDKPIQAAYAPHDLAVIRLATPTSHSERLATIADGASGFLYYVSVTGVTGARQPVAADIAPGIAEAKSVSGLPVCVGFGIKTPEQARDMAQHSDGVVVGSAFVDIICKAEKPTERVAALEELGALTRSLSTALKGI